ncbi:MAG: hypothetical protein GEU78_17895, partial [Actinobacteria bacterium]|nr:hypothetical protein [Actinomycetota bacterium]
MTTQLLRTGGSTRRWRALREACLARDERQCLRCGSADKLEAHHIEARADGGPDVLDNLVTLCDECHKLTYGKPRKRRGFLRKGPGH